MRIQFWGTRGSIATPGPETLRYGGNTPCTAVWTDDGSLIIFDCGTGARKLGLSLAKSGPLRAHLFIGHTHADHIQGLPFFVPAFLPGSHLTIYGPAGIDRSFCFRGELFRGVCERARPGAHPLGAIRAVDA